MKYIANKEISSMNEEAAKKLQETREFKTIKIEPTNLKDCYILTPQVFGDIRGGLDQIDIEPLEALGFQGVKKVIRSTNPKRGVIRGMHLQKGNFSQTKVVRCINGKVMDVVIDLREDSPTFGDWTGVELSPENNRSLYVPRGFAHGYLAAEDNTNFLYLVDNYYNKPSEAGLLYNDKDINIDWKSIFESYGINESELLFSDKDKVHPTLCGLKQIEKDDLVSRRHEIIETIKDGLLAEKEQLELLKIERRVSDIDNVIGKLNNPKTLALTNGE